MDTLPVPPAVLEKHVAVLGKTGSGKSNTAKVFVEHLLDRGERVCIIDPANAWWGMRLSASGREASPYPIAIFGGDRGDLAIAAAHGSAVAEAIGTSNSSAIISTRQMSVKARTGFFADFAETLLQVNRGLLHLVIDEAHLFAPQGKVPDPLSGRMLSAANELVSQGRGIGLRIILISQRPAKLHKDSLTQVETMVALRFIAPQDTDAIEDWIKKWVRRQKGADFGEDVIASLPSLQTGDAWVWAPEIGLLERVHFPLARTFDSGTPQAADHGPALSGINLDALRGRLETVEAEIKANDPAALRAEIARLRGQVSAGDPAGDREAVRAAAFGAGLAAGLAERQAEVDRLRQYLVRVAEVTDRIVENGSVLLHAVQTVRDGSLAASVGNVDHGLTLASPEERSRDADSARIADSDRVETGIGASPPEPGPVAITTRRPAPAGRPEATPDAQRGELTTAARRLLAVLVERAPARLTWGQVATLAGLKASGGYFNTGVRLLRGAGLVAEAGAHVWASETAIQENGGRPRRRQTPAEVLAMWCEKLPAPAPAMLRALAEREGVVPADLAELLHLQPRGGFWNRGVALLRNNNLVQIRGGVMRLAAELR
jgi:hypothetical protein